MKKFVTYVGIFLGAVFFSASSAYAVSTFNVQQGGTGINSATAHGIILGNGTGAFQVTSVGNSGQVLTSNGAGSDPTFQAATGGTFPFTVNTGYNSTTTPIGFLGASNGIFANSSSTLAILQGASTTLTGNFVFGNATGTNATTTSLTVSNLTSGNCVQAGTGGKLTTTGSACGAGTGSAYPFANATNFNAVEQATTSGSLPMWFQNGLQASTTFIADNSTTTNASTTSLFVGTAGSGGDGWTIYGATSNEWSTGYNSSNKDFQISSSTGLGVNNVLDITKAGLLTFTYASSTYLQTVTASSTNLTVSSAGGTPGCATFSTNGTISNTGTACGSGAAYSFTPITVFGTSTSATTTPLMAFSGIFASSSSVLGSTTFAQSGNIFVTANILVSSTTGNAPMSPLQFANYLDPQGIETLGNVAPSALTNNLSIVTQSLSIAIGSSTGIGFGVTSGANSTGASINFVRQASGSKGDFTFMQVAGANFNSASERFRIKYTNQSGFSTSSPFATLSIHANPTDPTINSILFAIGSSTSNATSTLFAVDNTGHIITNIPVTGDSARKPILGICGSATISATSTDARGSVNVSAGTPTACTITFAHPYTDTPAVFTEGPSSALGAIGVTSASSSGILFNLPAVFSGTFSYWVIQ